MSLKASELRIGNKILKHNGEIITVNLAILDYMVNYAGEKLMTNPPKEPFTPIPLSEEWLLKFGFRHSIEKDESRIGDFRLRLTYNEDSGKSYYQLWTNDRFDDNDESWSETISTYIKYVHQLQNLYFALTGEELTIKE